MHFQASPHRRRTRRCACACVPQEWNEQREKEKRAKDVWVEDKAAAAASSAAGSSAAAPAASSAAAPPGNRPRGRARREPVDFAAALTNLGGARAFAPPGVTLWLEPTTNRVRAQLRVGRERENTSASLDRLEFHAACLDCLRWAWRRRRDHFPDTICPHEGLMPES